MKAAILCYGINWTINKITLYIYIYIYIYNNFTEASRHNTLNITQNR